MKLIWLTDIHLNFLPEDKRKSYYQELKLIGDAIIISGDIAEAPSVAKILEEMVDNIAKPIYFVLGNHDYYYGQVSEVKDAMRSLTNNHPFLFWLGECQPIKIEDDVFLIGEDGWADGRYGDYPNTTVSLNDSYLIVDLFQARMLGKYQLLEKMQQLADQDANSIYLKLQSVAKKAKKIIVVTHIPPFKETALHNGKLTDDNFLPFFSSKATGDVLLKFAKDHAAIEILVLCGHTHDSCTYHALDNLKIFVGKSEYYQPVSQGVIDAKTLDYCF